MWVTVLRLQGGLHSCTVKKKNSWWYTTTHTTECVLIYHASTGRLFWGIALEQLYSWQVLWLLFHYGIVSSNFCCCYSKTQEWRQVSKMFGAEGEILLHHWKTCTLRTMQLVCSQLCYWHLATLFTVKRFCIYEGASAQLMLIGQQACQWPCDEIPCYNSSAATYLPSCASVWMCCISTESATSFIELLHHYYVLCFMHIFYYISSWHSSVI